MTASTLFGKLCVELRNEKEIVLLSLVNTAKKYEIENGNFVLYMDNDVEYQSIQKEKYLALMQSIVHMPIKVERLKEEERKSLEDYLKEKIVGLIIE